MGKIPNSSIWDPAKGAQWKWGKGGASKAHPQKVLKPMGKIPNPPIWDPNKGAQWKWEERRALGVPKALPQKVLKPIGKVPNPHLFSIRLKGLNQSCDKVRV